MQIRRMILCKDGNVEFYTKIGSDNKIYGTLNARFMFFEQKRFSRAPLPSQKATHSGNRSFANVMFQALLMSPDGMLSSSLLLLLWRPRAPIKNRQTFFAILLCNSFHCQSFFRDHPTLNLAPAILCWSSQLMPFTYNSSIGLVSFEKHDLILRCHL